jgi:hypothetical protein
LPGVGPLAYIPNVTIKKKSFISLALGQTDGRYDGDLHDVTDGSGRHFQTQASDVIDGRGKFEAKELEKELRSMSRKDLVPTIVKQYFWF